MFLLYYLHCLPKFLLLLYYLHCLPKFLLFILYYLHCLPKFLLLLYYLHALPNFLLLLLFINNFFWLFRVLSSCLGRNLKSFIIHKKSMFLNILSFSSEYNILFIYKVHWSVHSFNGEYLSIPKCTGSCEYLFREIPSIICRMFIYSVFFIPNSELFIFICICDKKNPSMMHWFRGSISVWSCLALREDTQFF